MVVEGVAEAGDHELNLFADDAVCGDHGLFVVNLNKSGWWVDVRMEGMLVMGLSHSFGATDINTFVYQ